MAGAELKLVNIITIRKKMKVLSGVRIGGSNEELGIGGIDNPIIRNPITKEPYIPGSSLKGSLRSILELVKGVKIDNGGICTCGKCHVCKIFGSVYNSRVDKSINNTQTRLIVRDAELSEKSRILLKKFNPSMVEIKKENNINRITSQATPRTFDRIPSGTEFNIELTLKIFEGDNTNQYLDYINLAFKLLQHNYIGSSGSRGYGKVEFEDIKSENDCFDIIEKLRNIEKKFSETGDGNAL